MSFYVGSYLILQDSIDLKHDSDSWSLPDTTSISGHMGETSNVEELLIKPGLMTLVPTQIQFGIDEWSADEGFSPDHEAFRQFYVRDEAFYVRGFVPRDYWTPTFYPAGNFYVRGFTPATELYSEFYMRAEAFYVRGFAPATQLYSQFYVRDEAFYVRSFTPTDWFYAIPEDC